MHQLQRIQWKFWHSLPKPSWGCRNHHQCAKDVISDIVQLHGSLSFLWSQSWGFVLSNPCFECCLHKAFGMHPQILSLRFKYQIFAKNIFFVIGVYHTGHCYFLLLNTNGLSVSASLPTPVTSSPVSALCPIQWLLLTSHDRKSYITSTNFLSGQSVTDSGVS